MTRPRPPIGNAPGTGKGTAKLPRHVSYEGRQRLSELAKRRHAQDGGFVARPGSEPRKRAPKRDRVAQLVAEAAREEKNAQAIIEVFKDGISDNQPIHIRIKAAEAWLGVEREEAKILLKEQGQEDEKRDRAELMSFLSEKLTTGYSAMALRKEIESRSSAPIVVEAVDVVIDPQEEKDEHYAD